MKKLRSKLIILAILTIVLYGCKPEKVKRPTNVKRELYENNIEIVKVRGCEYVLWHNGYGSDMEHYEDCNNH